MMWFIRRLLPATITPEVPFQKFLSACNRFIERSFVGEYREVKINGGDGIVVGEKQFISVT